MTNPQGQPQGWWHPPNQGQENEPSGQWPPPAVNPQGVGQQPQYPQPGQQQYWQPEQQQQAPQQQYWQPAESPAQAGEGSGNTAQYGGFGAFGTGDDRDEKSSKSKKPLFIGGGIVVVIAVAAVAAWLLGAFDALMKGSTLDQASAQDGVVAVLKDNYGEQDVKNAQCPAGQEVKNGNTFDCSVDVAGQPKKVTIRVLNDRPEFEVGAPK